MPIAAWGFAPALAAGNAVLLKPAELDPADRDAAGRAGRWRPGCPRTCSRCCRARARWSGSASSPTPASRKIVFTGSTEVGKQVMAGCAAQVKRGDPGAGRQERQHRLRRRRPGAGRGDRAVRRCSTTPARTAAPAAGSWCSASVLRPVPGAAGAGGRGVRGRRPGATRHAEMGPLISAAHQRDGWPPTCPTTPRSRSAARRREGPGFWFPPTVLDATAPDDRAVTEEIFGPVVAVLPFEDEADAIALANDTDYGLSGSIWTRRPSAGRCGSRARSRPATCRSTRTRRCATATPFGGFKQSGLGRELGPDAPRASPRPRTCSSRSEEAR